MASFLPESEEKGYAVMKDPTRNMGLGFTEQQRQELGLKGLLPPAVLTLDQQVERTIKKFRGLVTRLEQYLYLQAIQDTNETLYYATLLKHTYEVMPVVYTPVVGQACIEFSDIYRMTPRGMYFSILDKGNVRRMLDNWPQKDVRAIVFTDGERILGLGDQGCDGMGIPVGKLALYTACAGVHPDFCLPVTLDVGTNNPDKINNPCYMGLKQPRVRGPEYDAFVEEFMLAAQDKWGQNIMLQFEDFGNLNAFRLLDDWQNKACTFNDDIQGTSGVALAGILASEKLTGMKVEDHKYLFLGAGEAGVGIADLIAYAISKNKGITVQQAREQILLVDSRGLVCKSRLEGLQHHKLNYAHDVPFCADLKTAVDQFKPSALIGVSTIPQSFTEEILTTMGEMNKNPLIFALSNPTSKAECTAEQAYKATDGRAVYASGSPFDPLEYKGKRYEPGQGNNAYVFPGIGLGVVAAKATRILDDDMYVAAEALASTVDDACISVFRVYPHLNDIREVSAVVAAAVAKNAYDRGDVVDPSARPDDFVALCKSYQYQPTYDGVPVTRKLV
uniref:Malic enzyme n=1 Tax=Fibrocapsa japonica TaxID=94617 RepID=A0A7S2XYQ4_9STRA|mmetsp:Transcript_13854/g.20418  ORF Transcript_13854/g.20418 Transcript_13854/m.20418 type:complete len:560 (+) Transcript_13854:82-1761(+)